MHKRRDKTYSIYGGGTGQTCGLKNKRNPVSKKLRMIGGRIWKGDEIYKEEGFKMMHRKRDKNI